MSINKFQEIEQDIGEEVVGGAGPKIGKHTQKFRENNLKKKKKKRSSSISFFVPFTKISEYLHFFPGGNREGKRQNWANGEDVGEGGSTRDIEQTR